MDLPHPATIKDFNRLFPDEAACIEYIFRVRWPHGFRCPRCGADAAGVVTTRALVRCKAGHQISVTAGTALHRSKQKAWDWLYAVFLVSTLTPGISALQFQRQLGLKRYETAFQFLHKLRAALVDPDRERLRGEVEVDESFIGGVATRTGFQADKAPVVSAIEVVRWEEIEEDANGYPVRVPHFRAGRIRLAVAASTKREALVPWVTANVEAGSLLVTDGTSVYAPLEQANYRIQKHVGSVLNRSTGDHLFLTGLVISNLKAKLDGTYHGAVSPKHLQAYLNEFVFTFNRRFWRGPAFLRCLQLLLQAPSALRYDELYAAGEEGGWLHPPANREAGS